jgi:hypothetical protein
MGIFGLTINNLATSIATQLGSEFRSVQVQVKKKMIFWFL